MSINRELNPSLKDYKMIQKKRNIIEFVLKDSTDEDEYDIRALEIFEELKKYYQTPDKDTIDQKIDQPLTDDLQMNPVKEAQERLKFEKNKIVQKEALKSFKEIMEKEYHLVEMFRPHKLYLNFEEFYKEILDKQK